MKALCSQLVRWAAAVALLGGLGSYGGWRPAGPPPKLHPAPPRPFRLGRLKGKKLSFRKQVVDVNQPGFYGDKLISFGAAVEKKARLLKLKINTEPLLYHYCNDSIHRLAKNNRPEYLSYFDQKISLDALLSSNANQVPVVGKTFITFNGLFYRFTFKQHTYLVAEAQQRVFYRNVAYAYLLLLEVDKRRVLRSFAFVDSPEMTPACFGDFNDDGLLDYVDWRTKAPRISIFSLKEAGFVRDEQHYIIVKPSRAEAKYQQQYDGMLKYSEIDTVKTKWFYPL